MRLLLALLLCLPVLAQATACDFAGLYETEIAYQAGTTMTSASGTTTVGGGSGVHYLRVNAGCSYEYQYMGVPMGSKVGNITSYAHQGSIEEISPALWQVNMQSCWANGSDQACPAEKYRIRQAASLSLHLEGLTFNKVPAERYEAVTQAMANGKGNAKGLKVFFWVSIIGVLILAFVATQD